MVDALVECESARKEFQPYQLGGVMAIPKELLDILVCPVCKTPVKLTADNSGLKCETCHRVYPVRDEIPVMLPDEAKIEAS